MREEIKTWTITDDLTGKTVAEAGTYRIIDPATGDVWELDLGTDSYDKLVKALAPFLASGTKRKMKDDPMPPRASAKAPKADKPKTDRKPAAYDALSPKQKEAWKASKLKADADWKWAGRPSNDEIEAWLKGDKAGKADAAA